MKRERNDNTAAIRSEKCDSFVCKVMAESRSPFTRLSRIS